MDSVDLSLLRELERGLPLISSPFEEIGRRVGVSGDEVLERLRTLHATGVIRRFRARIDQRRLGITANALVAWKPAPGDQAEIGPRLAESSGVTHCYERRPVSGRWDYSFYTVHHGRSQAAVLDEVRSIAACIRTSDYVVLFSTREFKRVPNIRVGEDRSGLI